MSVLKLQAFYKSLEDCQAEVGAGWADLVKRCYDLCEQESDDVYICQVKEKFGGLRFYIIGGSDMLYDAIINIEHESLQVCEMCGLPGTPTGKGWIKTLCEEHKKELKEQV